MAAFAESHVEAAALAWLAELGYATANGQDIGPLQRHQVIERRPPHERSRPGLGLHADQCIVGFSVRISSSIRRRAREQRSEEHTSELQSLMRSSYAVFCVKKKKTTH